MEQFDDYHSIESARLMIAESALSVEVRSSWVNINSRSELRSVVSCAIRPYEYRIMVCLGGPTVALWGLLDLSGLPLAARLEYCYWSNWEEYSVTTEDEEVLLRYAKVLLPLL